jgi:predicted phage terminase large subunit-like protein
VSAEWRPNPGPQEAFHASPSYEVFYGGAAGGGKTESLVLEALRFVHVPGYSAIIFRRTYPELRQARGVIDRSKFYYPQFGGRYNEQTFTWTFPGAVTIRFGHLEHEDSKYDHKSAEYAFVGFDELTSFTETQYLYLMSRLRTTAIDPATGKLIPVRLRAASNPGDVGHEWVKIRFIDSLKPYEIKYFKRSKDGDADIPCEPHEKGALSRQFIPANLYDNPKLYLADPDYESRLLAMPLLERAQLLEGNWDILIAGNVFRPEWFGKPITAAAVPEGTVWWRGWDLATSVKTSADFTASFAVGFDKVGNVYLRDCIRLKLEWPKAKAIIKDTIRSETHVKRTLIEAKQHGLAAVQDFAVDPDLVGHNIKSVDVDTDKLSRALTWSARAEQGKVKLVALDAESGSVAPWVNGFLLRAALFDGTGATADDEIDAVSLVMTQQVRPIFKTIKFLALRGRRGNLKTQRELDEAENAKLEKKLAEQQFDATARAEDANALKLLQDILKKKVK